MSDDDFIPDVYDPFGETNPSYDELYYDGDSQSFLLPNQEQPVEIPDTILEPILHILEDDPQDEQKRATTTLKAELERLMEEKLPQEADQTLPKQIFQMKEAGIIFFDDSTFAGPTLRSLQGVTKNAQLGGFIILKASDCARIRSRISNHSKVTACLYVPTQILEGVGAFFE